MSRSPASVRVPLLVTPAHECGYLPRRSARTTFVSPSVTKSSGLLGALSEHGFRRSGEHIYRPLCRECRACIAVRVPVREFRPRRIQRRVWRRNQDLRVIERDASYREEHYRLYRRYVATRHRGGSMDNATPSDYLGFLRASWADCVLYEFRRDRHLVAVAASDRLPGALSAVYTFYDPEHDSRSLGIYCILWQIEAARRRGREWLYLGYWIEGCDKMRYKQHFLPQERLIEGRWVRFARRGTQMRRR